MDTEPKYTVDPAGRRWYDIEPIYHEAIAFTGEWYECPLCECEVSYIVGGDNENGAYPDEARCDGDCGYRYSE